MEFSRQGMVDEATNAGFTVTKRLVTDWVSLGLLGSPKRTARGKGSGRGARYVWPEAQRDLFLTLLAKRREVKSVASFCVLPVSVWLYWDDGWIDVEQARRAHRTWIGAHEAVGARDRALRNARLIVQGLVGGPAKTKLARELLHLLEDALYAGTFDRGMLEPSITALFRGRRYGPFSWPADQYTDLLEAYFVALRELDRFGHADYLEARARLRDAVLSYAVEHESLSSDAEFGGWFAKPTLQLLVDNCCRDVLRHLGLRVLADERERALPPVVVPTREQTRALLGRISTSP